MKENGFFKNLKKRFLQNEQDPETKSKQGLNQCSYDGKKVLSPCEEIYNILNIAIKNW